MSKQAVETFLKSLDENGDLKNELFNTVPAKARDAVRIVEFAGKHGFDFSQDELLKEAASYAAAMGESLSDEQLEAVVGGTEIQGLTTYGTTSGQLLLRVNLYRPMGSGPNA
ncbi:MAG: Nif11 domain [Acidobacteria bacterium]|jgi:predicted ribosomally synthesized peptide with nif11-like leader|nr:Nif11 domain [Acidobacteriota bacterium]